MGKVGEYQYLHKFFLFTLMTYSANDSWPLCICGELFLKYTHAKKRSSPVGLKLGKVLSYWMVVCGKEILPIGQIITGGGGGGERFGYCANVILNFPNFNIFKKFISERNAGI